MQSDVALDEAGHVGVAPVVALQRIALPQQQIVVQIGDEQPLMQAAGGFAGFVWRGCIDRIKPPVGDAGADSEKRDDPQHKQDQQNEQKNPHQYDGRFEATMMKRYSEAVIISQLFH